MIFRQIGVGALVGASAVIFSGCGLFGDSGAKQTMLTSSEVPSAEGTVEARKGENDNTVVQVRVKHLAPPEKLADDAAAYVVWIQPRNGRHQNAGALAIDDDLVGKLETKTPHRSFTLTITPEPSARVAAPSHKPVFRSEVVRKE